MRSETSRFTLLTQSEFADLIRKIRSFVGVNSQQNRASQRFARTDQAAAISGRILTEGSSVDVWLE